MEQNKQSSRREFLGLATAAIAAVISTAMGIPAIAYIIGPAFQRRTENWIGLGSTAKVALGEPTLFKAVIERETGWTTDRKEISAYVLTEDSREYIAMSNICTHLGCRVRWVAKADQFYCPCHDGIFDKQGDVVSGPPPRPLDRFEIRVQDGQILILGN
jgi:menaquinol-cytochrome c reductase iron-sulfur subunit